MKKTPPHIPKPKNSAGRDLKVAIPVGMYVGHTGRGTALVVGGVNALADAQAAD